MAWDKIKCKEGGPEPFDASAALAAADFSKSEYVNTSATTKATRQAFVWVEQRGFKVCVVGHIHITSSAKGVAPGNSYICGWQDWSEKTSVTAMTEIAKLADKGTFPVERYPKKIL